MMKALLLPILGIWALLNAVLKLAVNLVKVLWELLKTIFKLATGLIKVLWELLKTAWDTFLKLLPIVLTVVALAARGIGRAGRGIGKGGNSIVQRIRQKGTPPETPQ